MDLEISFKELTTHTIRLAHDNDWMSIFNKICDDGHFTRDLEADFFYLTKLNERHIHEVNKLVSLTFEFIHNKGIKKMKYALSVAKLVELHMAFAHEQQEAIDRLLEVIPPEYTHLIAYEGRMSPSHYEFTEEAISLREEMRWEGEDIAADAIEQALEDY